VKLHNLETCEQKRQFGSPRGRWENNTKIHLSRKNLTGVDWIQPTQDRVKWWDLVNTVIEICDFVKGVELIEQLKECQLHKKNFGL
jgi:hypothetical protein